MYNDEDIERRRAPRMMDQRSPMAAVAAVIGRYVMPANKPLYEVVNVYGPRLLGRRVNEFGETSEDLTAIDWVDGMEFLADIPETYLRTELTEDEEGTPETAPGRKGPAGWEVLNFLYLNMGREFTLKQISQGLGYGNEPQFALSKGRMVRFGRKFGDLVQVDRSGREHTYTLIQGVSALEVLRRIVDLQSKTRKIGNAS